MAEITCRFLIIHNKTFNVYEPQRSLKPLLMAEDQSLALQYVTGVARGGDYAKVIDAKGRHSLVIFPNRMSPQEQ